MLVIYNILIIITNMNYIITYEELTCINILIRTVQEAINRNSFDENEIEYIYKLVDKLTSSHCENC